jgi:very-short-patch-repair endonuclease
VQPNRRTLTRSDWTYILAYALRRNQTDSEKRLWQCLKDRQLLGFKFEEQTPIAHWIADFFCPAAGLVVELDGTWHRGRAERDKVRDKTMAEMHLHVLRIRSSLVFTDIDCAVGQIEWALRCSGADPLTEDDSLRLRLGDTVWQDYEPPETELFLRRRLQGLGFQLPETQGR